MLDPSVTFTFAGAITTYTAKSALFTAALGDRGTFFDNTGSYTITLTAAATLGAGWHCWIRNVSGTQTIDPDAAELINGAATYAVSNAGDIVLVVCTGTAFVVHHVQRPSTVAITGGTIVGTTFNNGAIGGVTPSTGAFTTLSASGVITSTLATGTAPFTVASTTVVPNLNVSQLLGSTWAAPGTIGSGTPTTGAFTTISASGVITSTLATGTAPFTVASTTQVSNLNVSQLVGATWVAPGTIGSSTPSTGAFTTLTASGLTTFTSTSADSVTVSGALSLTTADKHHFLHDGVGWMWTDTGASGGTKSSGMYNSSSSFNLFGGSTVKSVVQVTSTGAIINETTASTSTTTGSLINAGGFGCAGQITFNGNTGVSLRVTNGVANAAVATTLGSVGPTGSTAGDPQGWLRLSVAGTDRYIPFW